MKKLLFLFIILSAISTVKSQIPGMRWEIVYEDETNLGREIARTNDSCYVVTACQSDFDDGLTLKVDTAGNIMWTCQYGGYAIVPTIDNNYIIAGGLNYNSAFLRKIDDSGNSLWLKTYGTEGQDDFHFVIQCADSGIVAGGFSYLPTKNIYVIKTDFEGNAFWEIHFNTQGFAMATGAVEFDGYIYIVGRFETYSSNYMLFLAKIDQLGNTIWEYLYEGSYWSYSVIISEDNNLIVAGGNHLTKINLDGEQVWSTYLSEAFKIYAIQPTADNNFIVSGAMLYGSYWYQAPMMTKIDTAGNLLWWKIWYRPELSSSDNFESIIVADDHGYVACGYSDYGNTGSNLRVIKTYPDPNVITSVVEIPQQSEILLFPNPTKGKFTVSKKDIKKVEVYNISGEKILELNNKDCVFDITGNPKGIYLVKISQQGKTFTEKVVLE